MLCKDIDDLSTETLPESALGELSYVDAPERRVVRQLVEALLFERIVPFQKQCRISSAYIDDAVEAIFDHVLAFTLGERLFRVVGTISAFERVRLASGTLQCYMTVDSCWVEAGLKHVLEVLEVDQDTRLRLDQELGQTLSLCRWNRKYLDHHRRARRGLDFQTLESAVIEGHLYHPCFKTRTGFKEVDHRLYGPEAANQFQLLWLAVERNHVESTLPENEDSFWGKEIGVEEYSRLTQLLLELGADWRGYSLIPVHPWQYANLLPLGLESLMVKKEVLLLGSAGDFYHASQSLRTLVNVTDPRKANVKMPLNVVCTSSHRNLQSHFVHTAPVISNWIQNLVADDEYLQSHNNALFLSEYAGLLYEPTEEKGLQGCLGVIFRESVIDKLEPDQSALPFSALMLVEADGKPFIDNWVEQYGVSTWVSQLLTTMLLPIWHMLVHQGVAFEAHSQNLLLIHRNGWPEKIVLRDFHEDTEYVSEFLRDPSNEPNLAAVDTYFSNIDLNEGFAMEDIEALRELFMDTVYVFNLADIGFLLERFYGFSDESFWQLVKQQLTTYADAGFTSKRRLKRVGAEHSHIVVESLLKKKIMGGGVLDYYEHTVRNRLYREPISEPIPKSELLNDFS